MNRRLLIIEIVVFVAIAALLFFFALAKDRGSMVNNSNVDKAIVKAEKVQVFMFHATARCSSCIAIGQLASVTLNEYFSDELQSGRIEFREINIDLPENKELAFKFKASGSAFKINAIYDGSDHISEDVTVWRLLSDTTQFKNYLKGKIDNILGK